MTRSFGHIRLMGRGKYRVYWDEGVKPDGRRNQRSKTVEGTWDDANMFLAAKMVELGRGAPDGCTYGAYWASTIEPSFSELSEHTVREYMTTWEKHLRPAIAYEGIADTTYESAERVLRSIPAPSAQRRAYRLWKKMCNQAIRDRIITVNPIDRYIRLDPVKRRPKQLIEAHEVGPFMDAVRGLKYEPILLAELGGGLSPEEACALWPEDVRPYVDRGGEYALLTISKALTSVGSKKVLKDPKNGFRERDVLIGAPFAARLLELAVPDGRPFLYGQRKGKQIRVPEDAYASPVTVTHNWRRFCEVNGIKYVSQLNMRSSFATMHGEAGSPDSLVSGVMGHSDGTTKSRHYQRVTRRSMAFIADNLSEYIGERARWQLGADSGNIRQHGTFN